MDITQLKRADIQSFIQEHEGDEPGDLMLKASQYPDIPMREAVAQIQARQKARHKFPEWYQLEGVVFPPVLSVEQASSEATARFKAKLLNGEHLLDLTGGMGVDAYYLGQSFRKVEYVEQQQGLAEIAQHNFSQFNADHIRVHQAEATSFLESLAHPVDCIYLDPARRDEHARKVFRLEDCSPDVVALKDKLLAKSNRVFIKTAPLLDISAALAELQEVSRVWVIAVRQEVKEVLYLLEREPIQEPVITAVHLQGEGERTFTFSQIEEASASVQYAEPDKYIYEPNAAILKAGAFKSIAQRFEVKKLHPNSHLYTSKPLIEDFPGRIFQLQAISKYNRKALKKILSEGKANISTRNFPDSVQQIRKKTGLKDGGDAYVFATTGPDNDRILLICGKLS